MSSRLLITVFALAVVIRPALADDSAAGRKHWAFQTLSRPVPPAVSESDRVCTPVDRFLLAKLEAARLTFAPEADRTTLIRRAYLDLIGLPPTPDEVAAFEADKSTD